MVDVDNSGPVSIDIPPGTYNGTQLAEAVEVLCAQHLVMIKKFS